MRQVIRARLQGSPAGHRVPDYVSSEASVSDAKQGQLFTFNQIAEKLQVSHEQVRRMFRREPGVVHIGSIYRVPESVLNRVLTRMLIK
jgi:hypothetical protein